jgi:ssDNA-binding Zn-finger/Zn-ribbon topoisomerase 1
MKRLRRVCTNCNSKFAVLPRTAGRVAYWEGTCPNCGLTRQGFRSPQECNRNEIAIPHMVYA